MAAAMQARGRARGGMDGGFPLWVAFVFVSGIGLLWVYAAIRPGFGAGVKTAVIAGLAVWFFVGLLHAIGESPMGFMPERLMVIGTCVALVSIPVATVVGAYVYKEIRSEEHTSELQSRLHLVCRLLLEKKKKRHK